MLPVRFKVSYRLTEYVQLWREQFVAEMQIEMAKQQKPVSRHVGFVALCLSLLLAPPVFLYKVSKVGECQFTLDAQGVSRASMDGTVTYPWSQVLAIRKVGLGYLIATSRGAMPIPIRVLNEEQALEVANLIAAWERGRASET